MEHRKLAFFGESIGDSRQSHKSIEPEQKAKMSIPTHISFINYSEIMSGDGYETVAVPTEKRLEHIRNAFVSDLEGTSRHTCQNPGGSCTAKTSGSIPDV
jgi:hypothetical protein